MSDVLASIVARKREELKRRRRFASRIERLLSDRPQPTMAPSHLSRAVGQLPHVIAEIKHKSPSAGRLRDRKLGQVAAIASGYEQAGARAVSVLADGPGFGGSILDVRRASDAVKCPVLFKEFVLDELQLDLAWLAGASMILLIVRALSLPELSRLIRASRERGLCPVVEAADQRELQIAIDTDADLLGMNARDLRSFAVDGAGAQRALEQVPAGRVAIYMSGIRTGLDLSQVASGRADAALIGSELMQATDPGACLGALRQDATARLLRA